MNKAITAALIFTASLALFTFRLGQPSSPIFDEPCYVAGAKALMHGLPDANPEHPPMGKLLIGLGITAFGDNPFGWRIASAVAGAFSVAGAFVLICILTSRFEAGVLAALLMTFNNFTFVLARVAMLEIFIICFLIWGLAAWKQGQWVLAGFLFGCAIATKWSALVVFVTVIGLMAVYHRWYLKGAAKMILTAVVTYCASFGGRNPITASKFILHFHQHATGNPAINSLWFTWITRTNPERAMDYLVANPAMAVCGVLALVFCVVSFIKGKMFVDGVVVALFASSLLQWAIIGRTFSYYYYYAIAFTMLTLLVPVALRSNPKIFGVRLSTVVVVAVMVGFLIMYPKMTGLEAPYDCALVCIA
jgi:dolichyl-phosphate-mannose--protein O-mannosyl transferase